MVDSSRITIPTDENGIPIYSPYNNARKIVMAAIEFFRKHPSGWMAQKIEDDYGIIADYSDSDWGNEPQSIQGESETIISEEDNDEPF